MFHISFLVAIPHRANTGLPYAKSGSGALLNEEEEACPASTCPDRTSVLSRTQGRELTVSDSGIASQAKQIAPQNLIHTKGFGGVMSYQAGSPER